MVGSLSKLHEHSGLARRTLSNFRQADCVVDVDLSSCSGLPMIEELFWDTSACCDGRTEVEGDDDVRWANKADEMAMVVQPEAVSVETNMVDKVDADEEPAIDVDFQGTDPLQPEEVLAWVLSRINEVGQYLGVSFEGHEVEALKLFSTIEES